MREGRWATQARNDKVAWSDSGQRVWSSVTVLFSVVGFKLVQHLTTTTVPLVMGRTVAEAREALRDTGLDLGMVSYSEDGAGAAGAVIAQSPRAGQRVKPGTSIMVVVLRTAVAPSLATTTPSSPATSAPKSKTPAALRYPVPPGSRHRQGTRAPESSCLAI